jgi:anthraniloyl-CoA monooxygenase
MERRPVIDRFQEAAGESRSYFENTRRYIHLEAMPFAFHLLTRSGRIDYGNLRTRDPAYVDGVDRHFAEARTVAPPPILTPIGLRGLSLTNRIAADDVAASDSVQGTPSDALRDGLVDEAHGGCSLVLTPPVALSADGRITPGCPGLYTEEHERAWSAITEAVHKAGAALGVRLNHAGRRGATRERTMGVDRPLREGAWRLLAPSPIPYGQASATPEEMTEADLATAREAFSSAAARAAAAGIDLLMLHMAHGYLLGSFLSQLTNVREDRYGGDRESRMRYPLEVFDAVRAAWPESRPLGATIPVSDAARGGWEEADATELASVLRSRGCDLIEPVVGQTVPESRPRYAPGFLVSPADVLRNEVGVATIVGGGLTNTVQVNTILAAARADLCILAR